jgi:hypothetical protein
MPGILNAIGQFPSTLDHVSQPGIVLPFDLIKRHIEILEFRGNVALISNAVQGFAEPGKINRTKSWG